MDLIGIILASFLNLSVNCSALPAELYTIGGDNYLVLSWRCQQANDQLVVWRSWQRECTAPGGNFWNRPYFLQNQTTRFAFYVNRFGELQGGLGAAITDAYVPLCGS